MITSHHLTSRIFTLAVAAVLAATAQGCFTGIESTPKITAGDVKREKIEERPEDRYLADIMPQPPADWQPGKEFYVTDNKISLLLGASGAEAGNLAGTILRLENLSEVTSIDGKRMVEATFTTEYGKEVSYRSDVQASSLDRSKNMEVPFTIEVDMVSKVAERMKGKRYYIVTSSWYDTDDNALTGRRFIPVTVVDVVPGSTFYPIKLILNDDKGKPLHLFMSVGSDLRATRKFGSLLSLSNPRDRYPEITDANWNNIVNGRVSEDMTREECRLALGTPATVDRRPGYSIMREIWTYENGRYLIFEDGLLRSFRQ